MAVCFMGSKDFRIASASRQLTCWSIFLKKNSKENFIYWGITNTTEKEFWVNCYYLSRSLKSIWKFFLYSYCFAKASMKYYVCHVNMIKHHHVEGKESPRWSNLNNFLKTKNYFCWWRYPLIIIFWGQKMVILQIHVVWFCILKKDGDFRMSLTIPKVE